MQFRGDRWNALLLLLAVSHVFTTTAHGGVTRDLEERVFSYCRPDETVGTASATCRNAHYFDDLAFPVRRRERCFAACDDAVDDQVVSVMRTRLLRWLHVNTSVLEAPARLRQHQASQRRSGSDNAESGIDGSEGSHHNRVDARVWDAAIEVDKRSKIARSTIFLHFSSAAAFRSAKRRLRAAYREALGSFNSTLYESVSPLRDALWCPSSNGRNCSTSHSSRLPIHIRHWPQRHAFPTFVTFTYAPATSPNVCRACVQGLAAFHRLTESYDMLCRQYQRSVISCPPVVVFAAYPVDIYLSVLPQFAVQASVRAAGNDDGKTKAIGSTVSSGTNAAAQRFVYLLNDFPVPMSPFSYVLDHVTLVYDFLAFLVMQDIIQLQYLTKDEAQDIRTKAEAARLRAAFLKNLSGNSAAARAPNETRDLGDDALSGTPLASLPDPSTAENSSGHASRAEEDDPSPGVVRTVPDLLIGLVRATEAFDVDSDLATAPERQEQLPVYDHYYRFPPPQIFAARRDDEGISFDDVMAYLCDALSVAWLGLLLAVLISMRR